MGGQGLQVVGAQVEQRERVEARVAVVLDRRDLSTTRIEMLHLISDGGD